MLSRLRYAEFFLLLFPIGLAFAALASLALVRRQQMGAQNWAVVILGVAVFACHLVLIVRRPRADQLLLPLSAMLAALGFFVVARIRPENLERQTLYIAVGALLLAIIVWGGDFIGLLRRYRYLWAFAGIGILIYTFIFGIDPNDSGVRIWVSIAGNQFQPSEVVKILLVAFLASYLDEKRELLARGSYRLGPLNLPPLPYLLPVLAMIGLSLLLFLAQRDLGIVFLFFGVFMAMLYVTSGRGAFVVLGIVALLLASFLVLQVFEVARIRYNIWLDPWADPRGRGYQIIQALVGFASGGVFGAGPGFGSPTLIPAAHTDFPFAVISEELGLAGGLAVVCLYTLFVARGIRIALDLGDNFRGLLAFGLSFAFGLQALIILAGDLKLIPLTGITLPFISYGGSSLITNFILLGLLLRLSADAGGSGGSRSSGTQTQRQDD